MESKGLEKCKDIHKSSLMALRTAGAANKKAGGRKPIHIPCVIPFNRNTGGILPLLSIFAGLFALESLAAGVSDCWNSHQSLKNHELDSYAKFLKIPHLRGVFMRDILPQKSRPSSTWIRAHIGCHMWREPIFLNISIVLSIWSRLGNYPSTWDQVLKFPTTKTPFKTIIKQIMDIRVWDFFMNVW